MLFGDLCKDCKVPLDESNCVFKGVYLQPRCKPCWKIAYNKTPGRSKEGRAKQWLQWKYDISVNEYNAKLNAQLNGCAICKQSCATGRNLAVDHNHKTNVIRDLLCQRCNSVLGLVNEDEDLLINIIEYLKRHGLKRAL